ncbi:uncharacterized protein LOC112126119 isoform X2 [Cimex lectularius]|nr:uncharacterized protein LOC112126119 isoform X2 [Cimex lectularius]
MAYQLKSNSGKLHVVCGASLVTSNKLLTAAHCYEDGKKKRHNWMSQLSAVFQMTERCTRDFKSSSPIIHVQVHPQYNNVTFNNDIAVATLQDHVIFKPICLALPNDNGPSQLALILGFGKTEEKGQNSSPCKLNVAAIKIYSRKECMKTNIARSVERVSRVLCGGVESGAQDGCHGDSGGPLIRMLNNRYVLQGISSTGIGCGLENTPGVYTDVSAHRKWIDQNLQRVIRPPRPAKSPKTSTSRQPHSNIDKHGSSAGTHLPNSRKKGISLSDTQTLLGISGLRGNGSSGHQYSSSGGPGLPWMHSQRGSRGGM